MNGPEQQRVNIPQGESIFSDAALAHRLQQLEQLENQLSAPAIENNGSSLDHEDLPPSYEDVVPAYENTPIAHEDLPAYSESPPTVIYEGQNAQEAGTADKLSIFRRARRYFSKEQSKIRKTKRMQQLQEGKLPLWSAGLSSMAAGSLNFSVAII